MSYPNPLVFDYDLFIQQIPAYSDDGIYPEVLLSAYWDVATNFVSNNNYGALNGAGRQYGLNLLTAHLTYQGDLLNNGQDYVVLTAATVDKVNISLQAIATPTSFTWWLSTSPYGKTLRGLLSAMSAGGYTIGGSPEIGAFRRSNGFFNTTWRGRGGPPGSNNNGG